MSDSACCVPENRQRVSIKKAERCFKKYSPLLSHIISLKTASHIRDHFSIEIVYCENKNKINKVRKGRTMV